MRRGGLKYRLLIGLAIVAFAYLRKCSQKQENPYTGKVQTISLSAQQEIAIRIQQAPAMANQHGGLYPNKDYQVYIDKIGQKLVDNSIVKKNQNINMNFIYLKMKEL